MRGEHRLLYNRLSKCIQALKDSCEAVAKTRHGIEKSGIVHRNAPKDDDGHGYNRQCGAPFEIYRLEPHKRQDLSGRTESSRGELRD